MNGRRVRRVAAGFAAAVVLTAGGCSTPATTPPPDAAAGPQLNVSPRGERATTAAPNNPGPQIR